MKILQLTTAALLFMNATSSAQDLTTITYFSASSQLSKSRAISFETTPFCTTPDYPPGPITFPVLGKNSLGVNFSPAPESSQKADIYLVVYSKTATAPTITNKVYTQDEDLGNGAWVAYYGSGGSFTVSNLSPDVTYYFFAYSGNSKGPCFNMTPTTANEKTQNTDTKPEGTGSSSKLDALVNFNFAGSQNKWTNLTPIVFYGWSISSKLSNKTLWKVPVKHGHAFQVGPYIGTTIAIKDSTSYLPALMLPGNAGIEANYYLTFGDERKFSVVVSPLNLGLKVISGFTDTSLAVVQHNIRHAIGIRFADYFSASVQYTTGWHDATSMSKENFEKIFPYITVPARYLNLSMSTRLSNDLFGSGSEKPTPIFLTLNWRSMLNASKFNNLPNKRFITVGIITNLDLKSGTNPGFVPKVANF